MKNFKRNKINKSKKNLSRGRPIPLKNYDNIQMDILASELLNANNKFDSLPDCLAG